jgi:hypothetical protein
MGASRTASFEAFQPLPSAAWKFEGKTFSFLGFTPMAKYAQAVERQLP